MKKSIPFLLTLFFLTSLCIQAQPPIDAKNAEHNYQVGRGLLEEGRAAEALPYLQAAVKLNRESYLYRLNAGRAGQFSGNYQPCVENLTEALRLRPQGQTAQVFHLWRAECHAELGNRAAAASDFAKAVELQPGLKMAYSTRIFNDTNNACQGSADARYREANVNYVSNKIYEAYRDLYIALKCDPKHLPSLRLRLKIETADNNLATNAKFHRVQLEKIERAAGNTATAVRPKPAPAPDDDEADYGSSAEFLDKVFDTKKSTPATPRPNAAPAPGTLLNKYYAQLDKYFAGQPALTRTTAAKPVTGLYGAVFQGKQQLALDLIRQGADVNYHSVNNFGYKSSVLYEAISKESLPLIKALLDAGASPNCDLALKENCALGLAIAKKNSLYVALLIRYKANVNALFNNDGMTHLMLASTDLGTDIPALLIEAGADESPKNRWGETARQIAERKKREAAAEAAKPPPTPAEQRAVDIKMIGLLINGINSLTRKFNDHSEYLKKINGGLIHSEKIANLRSGIKYLDDIISNATEIERLAARVLNNPTATAADRQYMQKSITDAAKAKNDAVKLKKITEDKIREVS